MRDTNLFDLADEVRRGTYQPGPVRHVLIQEANKVRRLGILTMRDRVLQRAVLNALGPIAESEFLPSSFGYRPDRSIQHAVERIVHLRNRGLVHVVDADIRDCFGTLDHELLHQQILQLAPAIDLRLMGLIRQWMVMSGRPRNLPNSRPKSIGVLQGAPLSPLLCNVALHQLDASLSR